MSLSPFFQLSLVIQLHTLTALFALVLGPLAMLRRRRDIWHKVLGYGFVVSMVVTASTAAFIFSLRLIGPFSPIHLLIPVVFASLWIGVRRARAGDIAGHRAQMVGLYWQSVGVAGVLTFWPGRIMNTVAFGEPSWLGFAVVLGVGGGFMVWLTRKVMRG